jgi:hypothetical protein
MSNRKTTYGLIAFYVAVIFIAGCLPDPEDSLEWSADGSTGLLRTRGALFLVDDQTGQLTEIAKQNVRPWPDISKDGGLIAYSREVGCTNLAEGLKLLPAGQVEMIKHYAEWTRKNILDAGGILQDEFPFPDEGPLSTGDYKNWVIRYMCENADSELRRVLEDRGVQKGKEEVLHYYQVVVTPKDEFENKRVITTSLFKIMATRLSPDEKYVAYLRCADEGMEYDLYIASLEGDVRAMLVDTYVAFGYDWRKDSKAIAYLDADSADNGDLVLGSLKERTVADANGDLFVSPPKVSEQGIIQTHDCSAKASSLAGLIFYPWLKVQYGLGGRIFFSSCVLSLPMGEQDEPVWSLFCYDSVTGTVVDMLPSDVSIYTRQSAGMTQFALSPDGKKLLLPIRENRFICYEPATGSMDIPVEEDEQFGDEYAPQLVPSWKGNDEISFIVSGNSHFLPEAQREEGESERREVIILRDKESRILSENWPDGMAEELSSFE